MASEVSTERPGRTSDTEKASPYATIGGGESSSIAEESEVTILFDKAAKAVLLHFLDKNGPSHYDSAFLDTGLIGSAVDINGINARLRRIVIRSGDGGEGFDRDKLLEILKDLAVDAQLAMICLAQENWLGK